MAAETRAKRVAIHAAVFAGLGLLAFLTYRSLLDLAFVGYDTYPILLASRVLSWSDFVGTFTEELMDGYYIEGTLYRPGLNLSFALDYAFWGLNPRGYHVTDLLILVANATLLFALARTLLGADRWIAAGVAAVLFVVHPIQLEVFPVPPRRTDALCLAFFLAVLVVQRRPGRGILTGILVFLAMSAKETGAVVVSLVFAFHLLLPPEGGASLGHAVRRTVPAIAGAIAHVALRFAAIGGIGGHTESSAGLLLNVPELLLEYAGLAVAPQPVLGGLRWLPVTSLVVLALLAVVLCLRFGTVEHDERRSTRGAVAFLGVTFLALGAISSLSGPVNLWRGLFFLVPYLLLLGLFAERGLRAVRARRFALALPLLAVPLLLGASHVRYSTLFYAYPQWDLAAMGASDFLGRFHASVAAAQPGDNVVVDRLPRSLAPPPADKPAIRSTWILNLYSVEAYAGLHFPDRTVEVKGYEGEVLTASQGDDVVHVYIYHGVLDRDLIHR